MTGTPGFFDPQPPRPLDDDDLEWFTTFLQDARSYIIKNTHSVGTASFIRGRLSLDTVTYISGQLVSVALATRTEGKAEFDRHLRLVKKMITRRTTELRAELIASGEIGEGDR
jgi:hypothetical protein